jgi:hypothetical protein
MLPYARHARIIETAGLAQAVCWLFSCGNDESPTVVVGRKGEILCPYGQVISSRRIRRNTRRSPDHPTARCAW